jgi:type II secretory pathway component PulJ
MQEFEFEKMMSSSKILEFLRSDCAMQISFQSGISTLEMHSHPSFEQIEQTSNMTGMCEFKFKPMDQEVSEVWSVIRDGRNPGCPEESMGSRGLAIVQSSREIIERFSWFITF